MTELKDIKINGYVDYSSNNYGVNALMVTVGNIELYFSYKTIIAFRDNGVLTITKNYWGPTTGKHLNAISQDKTKRLSSDVFDQKLNAMLKAHGLI